MRCEIVIKYFGCCARAGIDLFCNSSNIEFRLKLSIKEPCENEVPRNDRLVGEECDYLIRGKSDTFESSLALLSPIESIRLIEALEFKKIKFLTSISSEKKKVRP